jgi:Protein of unknown function (DUF3089)
MPLRIRSVAALVVSLALAAGACSGDGDGDGDEAGASADDGTSGEGAADEAALPEDYVGYRSDTYADDAHWLCRPGLDDDVCSRDLDATAVFADGSTEVQPHQVADDPPIDCFYVYPTVSNDDAPNSDFEVDETAEVFAAYNQAARLTGACRVFAPIYRQATLGMIGGEPPEGVDPWQIAHDDVLDAFRHYIANDSDGRGFVLVGHSQGAAHLNALIAEEIDDQPLLRDRLVSALLLGWSVAVPDGEVVGGDFQDVPVCEAADQVGCVVSYASFRSTAPPPPNSFFGRPRGGEGVAACVNPASPEGGAAPLRPYFLVELPEGGGLIGGTSAAQPFADPSRTAEITTPFVTYPDLIEAECVQEGGFSYLSLDVNGDPADPRTDDIGGDLSPEWGMHLVDVNVAMGDLLELVSTQAETYATR